MRSTGSTLVLAALAVASPAGAQTDAPPALRVVALHGGAMRLGPRQARVGEEVTVAVAIVERRRGRITLRPLPDGAAVRWLRIEPRMQHRDTPPPNPGVPVFSNSVLFGPRHGRWIGYDTLEYDQRELAGDRGVTLEGATLRVRAAHPTERGRDVHGGVGSIWLAARVTLPDGREVTTPDARDTDRFGLSAEVMRIGFRGGDDYLGWLGTYFNVPFLFGSAGPPGRHQTDRYTGADCADVMIGGLRAGRRNRAVRYVSVSGIGRYSRAVSDVYALGPDGVVRDAEGEPVSLRWGSDVRPGDLLAIDYTTAEDLPRAWDHIGALAADRGPDGRADGILDGSDVLRHMGNGGLVDQALSRQGSIRFRLWRWEARYTRSSAITDRST